MVIADMEAGVGVPCITVLIRVFGIYLQADVPEVRIRVLYAAMLPLFRHVGMRPIACEDLVLSLYPAMGIRLAHDGSGVLRYAEPRGEYEADLPVAVAFPLARRVFDLVKHEAQDVRPAGPEFSEAADALDVAFVEWPLLVLVCGGPTQYPCATLLKAA